MQKYAMWRRSLPNFFTFGNMLLGFLSVHAAHDEQYELAAWYIIIAAIADALDGVMARLTKSSSRFGVELDSLADVISFGLAPAFLLYAAALTPFHTGGILIAAFFLLCGGFRLARFNAELVDFKKEHFKGLPIPTAAMSIASFILLMSKEGMFMPVDKYHAPLLSLALSLLMISHIKYDTVPKLSKRGMKSNPVIFWLTIAAIILTIIFRTKVLFYVFAAFILLGIFRQIFLSLQRLTGSTAYGKK